MKLRMIAFLTMILSAVTSTNAVAAPHRGHGRGYGHEWYHPHLRVGVGAYVPPAYYDRYYGDYYDYPYYPYYPYYGWGYYGYPHYYGYYGRGYYGHSYDRGYHGGYHGGGHGGGGHRR